MRNGEGDLVGFVLFGAVVLLVTVAAVISVMAELFTKFVA